MVQHWKSATVTALPDLDETEDFTPLHSQPGLRDLILYGCGNLTDFEILRPFTALRRLGLFGASLPAGTISEIVNTWPQLRNLELVNADWVTSIAPVTALPLEVLSIECPQLTDITPIARLPRLRWLYIGGSPFPDLRPVTALTRLQFLNISRHGYPLTLDLTPISQLPALRHLSLYDVPGDTDLTPLEKMREDTQSQFAAAPWLRIFSGQKASTYRACKTCITRPASNGTPPTKIPVTSFVPSFRSPPPSSRRTNRRSSSDSSYGSLSTPLSSRTRLVGLLQNIQVCVQGCGTAPAP